MIPQPEPTREQFAATFCAEDWLMCTRSWEFIDLVEAGRYGAAHALGAKICGAVPLKYRGRTTPHPEVLRN